VVGVTSSDGLLYSTIGDGGIAVGPGAILHGRELGTTSLESEAVLLDAY